METNVGPEAATSVSLREFDCSMVCEHNIIGNGGFGLVSKGTINRKTVAIKRFRAPFKLNFLSQLSMLVTVNHQNVISVLGFVKATKTDGPQLVMEYFSEQNILEYLNENKNLNDLERLLGKVALDVIEGCVYLHSRSIILGTLAARNVLVDKKVTRQKMYLNARISDVGLLSVCKPFGENYLAIPESGRVVPVKWVPKEIVEGNDFSMASDVWSFGVMLWEMWTPGAIPYGTKLSEKVVIRMLKLMNNYSPLTTNRPLSCPLPVIQTLKSIFRSEPSERPTFIELREAYIRYKGYGENIVSKSSSSLNLVYASWSNIETEDDIGSDKKSKTKLENRPFATSSTIATTTNIADRSNKQSTAAAAIIDMLSTGHRHQVNRQRAKSTQCLSRAPPPYTKKPPPHHSAFVQLAGHSGGNGQFVTSSNTRRNGKSTTNSTSSVANSGNEHALKKIKMLAGDIQRLQIQKTTQELLLKSSEMADLMMTVEPATQNQPRRGKGNQYKGNSN